MSQGNEGLGPENAPGELEIASQLDRVLRAQCFCESPRAKDLLSYIVENSLKDNDGALKEIVIAREVFERTGDFNPQIDSVVRSAANRLRKLLRKYYVTEGRSDPVLIEIPEGRYVPRFSHAGSKSLGAEAGWGDVDQPPADPVRIAYRIPATCHVFTWGGFGIILLALLVLASLKPRAPGPVSAFLPGRLLARSTSEGHAPRFIRLTQPGIIRAMAPDGKKLFASGDDSRILSIVQLPGGTVRTLDLPINVSMMAMAPDGRLFIGSSSDGLIVVDSANDRIQSGVIRTGGPVRDLAVSPDGSKLYLALGPSGIKTLLIQSGELRQLTDTSCPERLAVDPQGIHLYATYQCSGLGGRAGHNSLEIFDAAKESSLGVFQGPAMVGGDIAVSPNGTLLALDGWDACETPEFDHIGCPSVPSHVFQLLRASDRYLLKTFDFPHESRAAHFLDNHRLAVGGRSLTVMDVSKFIPVEHWPAPDGNLLSLFVAPSGKMAFASMERGRNILLLETEPDSCSPPRDGLSLFFTGDGTLEDEASAATLKPQGTVTFTPARVGQGFAFDGQGYLVCPWTAHYHYFRPHSTFATYAKFAPSAAEMTLMDWTATPDGTGDRLVKASTGQLVFQSGPDWKPSLSSTRLGFRRTGGTT
jgi:hypothetical protein